MSVISVLIPRPFDLDPQGAVEGIGVVLQRVAAGLRAVIVGNVPGGARCKGGVRVLLFRPGWVVTAEAMGQEAALQNT